MTRRKPKPRPKTVVEIPDGLADLIQDRVQLVRERLRWWLMGEDRKGADGGRAARFLSLLHHPPTLDMKRIAVYPEPRTLRILGRSSPQLNLALECWAKQVAQGAVEVEDVLTRPEWCYLADCLNRHMADPREDGESLALTVLDAHEIEGTGEKWFESEAAEHVEELNHKLLILSYPAVWAVFSAVQFFWDNSDAIDLRTDEWWRVSFRTRFSRDEDKNGRARAGVFFVLGVLLTLAALWFIQSLGPLVIHLVK